MALLKYGIINTGQNILEVFHNGQVNQVTFSPDSTLIATASSDHTAKVWRLSDGKEIITIPHNGEVIDVAFNPDGSLVVSAGWDGIAQIWNVANRSKTFSIMHDKKINRILFSPNNKWVITASEDHSIQVWDLIERKMKYKLLDTSSVTDVNITSDSNSIVSGDENGNIITWNTQLGRQNFIKNMGISPIKKIAVSPDGKFYAAGNEAGNVCVWQIDNGEKILCFSANNSIWDIIFSSSDYVLAASLDGYVHVWDLNSKSEYLRIGNPGMVLSIDLELYNKLLAMSTTSGASGLAIWKKEDIIPLACDILPRQLTEDEWREYLGDAKYSPFCPIYLLGK